MRFIKFALILGLFYVSDPRDLASQNYWSKHYVTDYSNGNKFVAVDDGMIVLIDQGCFLTDCAALMKVDYSGNLLWVSALDSVQTGHVQSIALENSTILVNVEYTFIGSVMPFKSYSVFRYNTDGEFQGKFDYFFTVGGGTGPNTNDWPYEIITTIERRYVCNAYANDSGYRVRIRAYDEDWNQLWQKNLNGGNEIMNLDMELTIDSGLVVTYSYWSTDFLSYNSIERYDKDGNLLWVTPFEENYGPYSNQVSIAAHPDGTFLGIRKVDLESSDPEETDSPDIIYKLAADGHFLWQKFDTEPRHSNHLFATSNGDVIICGIIYPLEIMPTTEKGYVSRMDSNGNVLWERYFSDSTNTYLNTGIQFGQELINGDLVFSGRSSGLNFPPEAWLLKTDGNGCIRPDCSSEVQVHVNALEIDKNVEEPFAVYPNPFTSSLVFGTKLNSQVPNGSYEAVVFDAQGRRINAPVWIDPDVISHFDMGSQPVGIYILVIYKNGKPIQSLRAIKN